MTHFHPAIWQQVVIREKQFLVLAINHWMLVVSTHFLRFKVICIFPRLWRGVSKLGLALLAQGQASVHRYSWRYLRLSGAERCSTSKYHPTFVYIVKQEGKA